MEKLVENRRNYENDLILAAKLGKSLLEENKELQNDLGEMQKALDEKEEVNLLLQKQLELMRKASDSRMKMYEEFDKNSQELEKTNENLKKSNKEKTEKIHSLTSTLKELETKCDEFQAKMEQLKKENKSLESKSNKEVQYQRNWSVPNLIDDRAEYKPHDYGSFDYLGFPSLNEQWKKKKVTANNKEIKDLKDSLKAAELKYYTEKYRREDLESDLRKATTQKQLLENKVRELQDDLLRKQEMKRELEFAAVVNSRRRHNSYNDPCANCSSRAASITGSDFEDHEFLEHDLEDLPNKEVVRLKCGGSAYGSRESLNLIGLETVTPTLESCSDILATAFQESQRENTADVTLKQPDPDSTLLGEMEEQYRKLVKKYEHLVECKKQKQAEQQQDAETQMNNTLCEEHCTEQTNRNSAVKRRPKSLTMSKEVQTAWRNSSCVDYKSPEKKDPTEGHFEDGPPEYKKLFKEIFETLRRSSDFDASPSPE